MFIYILIFIYLFRLAYVYDIKQKRNGSLNFHYIISCIILITVAGVRYRIGYDTINYMNSFQIAPTLQELMNGAQLKGDLIWGYLMGFSKEIYNDFFVVQILQSIIVNGFIFWFIKRQSPKPFLGVLLYFLLQWWNLCFEAMREAIAISFFLYGMDALLSGKGLKGYYLRVWPAVFAHTFGFITLFFPFIRYLRFNKFSIVVYIAIIVLLFSVKDYVNDITMLIGMVSDDAVFKADKYFNSDTFGESNLSLMGIISLIIGYIFPCISIMFLLVRNQTKREQNPLIPYVFIYICFVILKIQIPIFYRFLNYFELLVIVAFTQALFFEKNRLKLRLVSVSMMLMILVRLYSLSSPDVGTDIEAYHRYLPYNSIFQKDFNHESEIIFSN